MSFVHFPKNTNWRGSPVRRDWLQEWLMPDWILSIKKKGAGVHFIIHPCVSGVLWEVGEYECTGCLIKSGGFGAKDVLRTKRSERKAAGWEEMGEGDNSRGKKGGERWGWAPNMWRQLYQQQSMTQQKPPNCFRLNEDQRIDAGCASMCSLAGDACSGLCSLCTISLKLSVHLRKPPLYHSFLW